MMINPLHRVANSGFPLYLSVLSSFSGRHYEITEEGEHVYTNPFTPLEVFPVTEGDKYYFRVICSALTFPFSISIDGHPLHVVASDGHHIVTEVVDFLILTSGERYDFWIDATNPDGLGNFWIRAETLEVDFQELGNVGLYGTGVDFYNLGPVHLSMA